MDVSGALVYIWNERISKKVLTKIKQNKHV